MTLILVLLIAVLALGFGQSLFLQRVHALQKDLADEVAKLKSEVRRKV